MFHTRIAVVVVTYGTVSLLTAAGMAQSSTPGAEQPALGSEQSPPTPAAEDATSTLPQQTPAQSTGQGSQATVNRTATAGSPIPAAAPVAAAQRPAETNTAPVAPIAQEPERKEATLTTFPTKLFVTKDNWLQVGALLQGWFDTRWNSQIPDNTSRNSQSSFRIRRAELKVSGSLLHDSASFLVTLDPAATYKYDTKSYTVTDSKGASQTITPSTPPGNTAALKLFWISLKSPFIDAAIGQFKYPMSYEGLP